MSSAKIDKLCVFCRPDIVFLALFYFQFFFQKLETFYIIDLEGRNFQGCHCRGRGKPAKYVILMVFWTIIRSNGDHFPAFPASSRRSVNSRLLQRHGITEYVFNISIIYQTYLLLYLTLFTYLLIKFA